MPRSNFITLLTDFGTQDVYVGVMKGVIAQICPTAQVIDLTHALPPQDVAAARFHLMNAYPYFPEGTIHVAVVDPGVGSTRRAIALQLSGGVLVAPDNGLVSGVLAQYPDTIQVGVELTNPDYWRSPTPSATFHGRDIFAPVAAHLAAGVSLEALGTPLSISSLVPLPLPPYETQGLGSDQTLKGCIQAIDHFGNGVTTIPAQTLQGQSWVMEIEGQRIPMGHTYGDRPPGDPLMLVGSHGWVEVAVNQGHAASQLGLRVGSPVTLRPTGSSQRR